MACIRKPNRPKRSVKQREQTLKDLDAFVLDNSLRETTVSQTRGHTLQDKWNIFTHVKKCGFQHIVVATFSEAGRVDDVFVRELIERGEDISGFYAFVNFIETIDNGIIDTQTVPIALLKMKELKMNNPIIEMDLDDSRLKWSKKDLIKDLCSLLLSRIQWAKQNLCSDANIFVNFRDFPFVMEKCPGRVLEIVRFLGRLDDSMRPIGLMYEDATGEYMPQEMAQWTQRVRSVMNSVGWRNGNLLTHVHQKWGLADAVQLECLKAGANGMWAGVCEEGSAFGHACSSTTLMNLIRLGNTKVLERYNCTYLRKAAIEVTKITTGIPPHSRQCVSGERIFDISFNFGGIAGGVYKGNEFDMAKFFSAKRPIRMNTLVTEEMILENLNEYFGEHAEFTQERAALMKAKMYEDLINNRKEEYMTPVGLALLFDRTGGHITPAMRDVITEWDLETPQAKMLIALLRDKWDACNSEGGLGADKIDYRTFYNHFMKSFSTTLNNMERRKAVKIIDIEKDGMIYWNNFLVYIKWAIIEYPDICDLNQLLSVTFKQGIIPATEDKTPCYTPCKDFTPGADKLRSLSKLHSLFKIHSNNKLF